MKSLLTLLAIFLSLFAFFSSKKTVKYLCWIASTLLVVAYLFFSHWIVLDRFDPQFEAKVKCDHYSPSAKWLPIGSHYALMPTAYCTKKEIAWTLGKKYFPFGIGGNGMMVAQDSTLEAQGMDLMQGTAPHSTFWGAFAELGLLGVLAVLAIFWVSFQAINRNFDAPLRYYLLAMLAFLLLEGITVDLSNVRVLWVLLAMLSWRKP